nr:hypothetical protein [Actinomycetota bacterium]
APVLDHLHRLWEYCADPGRPVTQEGNLRLADARHLVELLPTSDTPVGVRGGCSPSCWNGGPTAGRRRSRNSRR